MLIAFNFFHYVVAIICDLVLCLVACIDTMYFRVSLTLNLEFFSLAERIEKFNLKLSDYII